MAFSLAKKTYIGLDLSNTAVKVVELKPSGKSWRLTQFAAKPLPRDAVVDRQVKNVEAVGQVIQEIFQENSFSSKQVVSSLSGSSLIIKKIQVPLMSELDLEDQISLEAEEYIPFDIEDVYLDFQVIGKNPENQDVLLVACKKEIVDDHLKAFDFAGVKCQLMDADLFALQNAYHAFLQGSGKEAQKGIVVLVNGGETLMNINILQDGVSLFTRDQIFGTRNLLEDIQMQFGVDGNEAEAIRRGENVPAQYNQNVLHPFLEQLSTQITQTLDFFRSMQPEGVTLDQIILSGGCAMLPGVEQSLASMLQLSVKLADPLAKISIDKNVFGTTDPHHLSSLLMVALGLAIRGGDV